MNVHQMLDCSLFNLLVALLDICLQHDIEDANLPHSRMHTTCLPNTTLYFVHRVFVGLH